MGGKACAEMGVSTRIREKVVSPCIDVLEWDGAVAAILNWAMRREHRFVTVCNVHSVVTARTVSALRDAINESDMATPDGMPVAWVITQRRQRRQQRISGMELTLTLCAAAEKNGISVAFYGSVPHTLDRLGQSLRKQFPSLTIGATISPPFRELTSEELSNDIRALNESGAGIVFVGLGCPKQEIWMHQNRDRINAVQIGIGAAFEFIAGTVKRPPKWMQRVGLEWLGRLLTEPRRLWRRYFVTNSVFLVWLAYEAIAVRGESRREP